MLATPQITVFQQASEAASKVIATKGAGHSIIGDPRPAVTQYVSQHSISEGTYPSLAALVKDVGDQVQKYGSLNKVPSNVVGNTRNDMYLTSEAIRFLMKDKQSDLSKDDVAVELYRMRNALAHGYDSVNLRTVWNTIQSDLPILKQQVMAILRASKKDG